MKTLRIATLAALTLTTSAFATFPTLYLKNVCDDQLHAPTNITNAADGSGRLFICDQPGKVYIFQNGMLNPSPFLDLTSTGTNDVVTFTTGYNERGLLGMCFHPGYANPMSPGYRCFYVNFTAPNTQATTNPFPTPGPTSGTNCVSVIAEYKVSTTNPNVADTSTKRIVLTYAQPQSNHNGGQLEFGPDGYLYISAGDGGGANDNPAGHSGGAGNSSAGRESGTLGNAQDRRQLLGKILRIDPQGTNGPGGTYGIPASNPFVGQTQDLDGTDYDGAMRGEIFAYGVRNPWRFSFDSNFGGAARLICADVGQLDVEEINFITNGGNYGWRVKEGNVGFDTITAYTGVGVPTLTDPIAQYTHSPVTLPGLSVSSPINGTSITGGYVYRGTAIPSMAGKYVFADYAANFTTNANGGGGGKLLGLEETTPGNYAMSILTVGNPLPSTARIYCFGKDENGELFFAVKTTHGVLELDGGKPAGTIYKIQAMISANVACQADLDNTLYETSSAPYNSNGIGQGIFSGLTGDLAGYALRRALIRFDLSPIPPGAVLSAANVQLTITRQIADPVPYTLHKATASWGEGPSNAPNGSSPGGAGGAGVAAKTNDATWAHRFFSTQFWTTPGGDFVSTASGSGATSFWLTQPVLTLSGSGLLTDVQAWIATPATNFGWLLKGDEVNPATATRFASRQNTVTASRPKLNVTYSAAPQPTRFETWYSTYFPTNPAGTYLDPAGDSDGDGIANQVEYAFNYNPSNPNAPGSGLTTSRTDDTINTTVSVSFRRDPRATDLTYELQSSDDMSTWTTIVTSTGGAAPTGDAVVSDAPVIGESPMMLVSASETLPGLEVTHFIRLKVSRAP